MSRALRITVPIVVLGALAVLILLPLGAGRQRWRPIADHDALYAECVALARERGGDELASLARSAFPPSVAALRPVGVGFTRTYVYIGQKGGGIGDNPRAYIVFVGEPDFAERGGHHAPTEHAHIYRWWSNGPGD